MTDTVQEKTTLVIDDERITEYDVYDVERHAAPLLFCEDCDIEGDVTTMHRESGAWLCGPCVSKLYAEHEDWMNCARFA